MSGEFIPASAKGPSRRTEVLLQRLGLSGSLVCVVHCALWPVLLVSLPASGLRWLGHTDVELALLTIGMAPALWLLVAGRHCHRSSGPLILLTVGILLGSISAFLGEHHLAGSVTQWLAVVGAVLLDRRLRSLPSE